MLKGQRRRCSNAYPLFDIFNRLKLIGYSNDSPQDTSSDDNDDNTNELRKLLSANLTDDVFATDIASANDSHDVQTQLCGDCILQDIPCSGRYNGSTPDDNCYPGLYTGAATQDTDIVWAAKSFGKNGSSSGSSAQCSDAVSSMCNFIETSGTANAGKWTWSLNGQCLLGVWLSSENPIRYPNATDCTTFLTAAADYMAQGNLGEVGINLKTLPTLPLTSALKAGATASVPLNYTGLAFNASVSSWLFKA